MEEKSLILSSAFTQVFCFSTSIMVAQFLQKLTYEKVQTIVKELLDLAEKCKSLKPHESPSECCHQLMTTFLEHICNNQGLADRHVFSDCCNTNNSARHKCFLSYKKDVAGYSDIFQISNPEQICEMDKENPVPVKEKYIYETSRKHPFLYGPTILTMSACYETAVQSCCREENKTECFQIKRKSGSFLYTCATCLFNRAHWAVPENAQSSSLPTISCGVDISSIYFFHQRKSFRLFSSAQKILYIQMLTLSSSAWELVLLTKKQPKANFSEIAKLAMDIKNLHQICCEGNAVACVLGRSQLMNYTCSKQATLSSKITPCCELPEPFRGECIINSENDKPDLLSLPLSRFTEDQFVCKQFTDKQDDFLQEFLYEYSRRHPELAVPVILRVDTVYQNLLGKCCKLENPLECYSHGEEMFQRVVRESHEHVKNQCDLHEKLGDSNFHDRRHEAEPINAGVGHCCDDSYAFRKPCFDDLQEDATYISPHLSCDQVVNLNEDLCRAQEEELQTEKQKNPPGIPGSLAPLLCHWEQSCPPGTAVSCSAADWIPFN
ncbi:alpha-fetoprotein-like [Eschrichtius robustus]|uniref:alpha-fetoprotein-like n=1 Tax=Eschrichtius robustus TaxID=9764 RepID=UPI0035C13466